MTTRVLVVDDMRTIRITLGEFLRDAGYEVDQAEDAKLALEMIAKAPYDVVVSDIVLPEMTGVELLQELSERWPRTQVIMMTGLPTVDTAAEAVRLGAYDYLSKPVGKDDILRVVANAARVKELEDEKERLEAANQEYQHNLEALVEERTEALRESERRYRQLVDGSPDGIVVLVHDDIIFANNSFGKILDKDPAELVGNRFWDFVSPSQAKTARRRTNRTLSSSQPSSAIEFCILAGGKEYRLEAVAMPLTFQNVPAVQLVCRDVTLTRQIETQLRQSQRMDAIGRLASGVAHDFNNLLTVILGQAQLMQVVSSDDENMNEAAGEIVHAAEKASVLTRRLLAFGRKQKFEPVFLDLNKLIDGLARLLIRLVGEEAAIDIVPDPALELVKADPAQMEQVLMNLVVNARDAMPDGGKITIETGNTVFDDALGQVEQEDRPGKYVVLTVTDEGCGMSSETMARSFEPFFTTKEGDQGTGLGLATVYGVVKQSGGHVEVQSTVGKGSTFRVYIPVAADIGEDTESEMPLPPVEDGNESILVAEDDRELLAATTELLAAHGYQVSKAVSGVAALRLLDDKSTPIDMLLTDVVMPGMNGVELAEKVSLKFPGVRTLFMSGYSSEHVILAQLLESKANYIQKPFSPSTLLRQVREVIDNDAE